MDANDPKRQHAAAAAAGLTIVGTLLLLAGLVWPNIADPTTGWSDAQAQEYSDASLALHAASHGPHADDDHVDQMSEQELQAARARFQQIKAQLEAVQQRPGEIAYALKACGGILATLGAISLLIQRGSP